MWRRRTFKIQCLLLFILFILFVSFFYCENENTGKAFSAEYFKRQNVSTTEEYIRMYANSKRYVTKSLSELGRMDEINKHFLFLNSIPKSGSEVLIFILERIQGLNNFKHVRLKGENRGKLTKLQQENIIYNIYDIRKKEAIPLSFDRKVYFINFTAFDKQSPTYVNLIRDPVEKVLTRIKKLGRLENYTDICISPINRECKKFHLELSDLSIPYFCGHDSRCMQVNNSWALDTAKVNVEKYFPVVGILERLNATLNVLEQKIPYFFKGANQVYHKNLYGMYKKRKNMKIANQLRKSLGEALKHELIFYEWVKKRLIDQVDQLKKFDERSHKMSDS